MNSLRLVLEAPPTASHRALPPEQLWGCAGEQANDWAAAVERSAPYVQVVSEAAFTRFWFAQSDI